MRHIHRHGGASVVAWLAKVVREDPDAYRDVELELDFQEPCGSIEAGKLKGRVVGFNEDGSVILMVEKTGDCPSLVGQEVSLTLSYLVLGLEPIRDTRVKLRARATKVEPTTEEPADTSS